jgi:MraZ protein
MLAKERPGCLSLWMADAFGEKLTAGIDLVRSKVRAGKLQERQAEVQLLGRLLSTRHKRVPLAGRGRLLVPEGCAWNRGET